MKNDRKQKGGALSPGNSSGFADWRFSRLVLFPPTKAGTDAGALSSGVGWSKLDSISSLEFSQAGAIRGAHVMQELCP